MIITPFVIFSDKQLVSGATTLSTNVIDLGVRQVVPRTVAPYDRDIGPGWPSGLCVRVTTAFTGGVVLRADVIMATTPDMITARRAVATSEIPIASAVVGAMLPMIVLPGVLYERYMAIEYVTGGTGNVSAFLTMAVQTLPRAIA